MHNNKWRARLATDKDGRGLSAHVPTAPNWAQRLAWRILLGVKWKRLAEKPQWDADLRVEPTIVGGAP